MSRFGHKISQRHYRRAVDSDSVNEFMAWSAKRYQIGTVHFPNASLFRVSAMVDVEFGLIVAASNAAEVIALHDLKPLALPVGMI